MEKESELMIDSYLQLIETLIEFSTETLKLEETKRSSEMVRAISELWMNVFEQIHLILTI